jgi:hypothetical protein
VRKILLKAEAAGVRYDAIQQHTIRCTYIYTFVCMGIPSTATETSFLVVACSSVAMHIGIATAVYLMCCRVDMVML